MRIWVTDGSLRHATALEPGRATKFSYTIRIARGEYSFGRMRAVARIAASRRRRISFPPFRSG